MVSVSVAAAPFHVQTGTDAQMFELAVSVTVCAFVRASVATITNVILVGVLPAALLPPSVALVHPRDRPATVV